MNNTISTLTVALASLATANSLHAQTRIIYVDQTRPFNGDGSTWIEAFRSIADAVAIAGTPDPRINVEIHVSQGVHRPSLSSVLDDTFIRHRQTTSAFSLSIMGGFGGLRSPNPDARDLVATPTIISGDRNGDDTPDGLNREDNAEILLFASRSAPASWSYSTWLRLDGLVFEGSALSHYGSAAVNLYEAFSYHSIVVRDCVFRDNRGAGLSISGSAAHIDSCRFERNAGQYGGGLTLFGPGWVDVLDSHFEENTAYEGGGVYSGTSTYLVRCVIAGNRSLQEGGGVYGDVGVFNSLIASNTAGTMGGGHYGYAYFDQSTIVDNRARWGGGIHGLQSSLLDCIVARNEASVGGSQISMGEGILDLDHCLLQGDREGVFLAFDADIVATGLIDVDPRFRNPDGPDGNALAWHDNDYHLAPNSLAINAGNTQRIGSEYNTSDLEGHRRPMPRLPGGPAIPDLGCYEYQPRCPADTNQDDGVTTDDLLDFLTAYTLGQPLADIDDGSATNTPDDGVTIDDLLFFLARYNAGC